MKTIVLLPLAAIMLFTGTVMAHQQVAVVPLGGTKIVSLSNFSGTWTTDTNYQTGQTVEIDGSTYVCITAHNSGQSLDMSKWSLIAAKGDQGIQGGAGPQGDPGANAMELQNVVTVSATGADFTDPVAAVNSISDATSTNPYLVYIGPGVYTLAQTLIMKPYISIQGAGKDVTWLTGTISSALSDESSCLVSGASNSFLKDLTIENTGGTAARSTALFNNNSSPYIFNVRAISTGGTYSSKGIYNFSSSAPEILNVAAHASGAENNHGINNDSSSPYMENVNISASGGVNSHGIINGNSSSPTLIDVISKASGSTTLNDGMRNVNSSAMVRNSILEGSGNAIYLDGGSTRIIQSSLTGNIENTGGILTCVNSDNGVATALNASCQ